jgi:hypothetical protein
MFAWPHTPKSLAAATAALLAAAFCASGCGSSSTSSSASAPSGTATASVPVQSQPLTKVPSGRYVATLTSAGLQAQGVDVVGVGGGGVWHLSISPHKLTFTPPGHSASSYSIVSLTKSRITLGPNPQCSTAVGKSQNSVFTLSQAGGGVRFVAVKKACTEDVGALAVAPWHTQ